MSAIIVNEKETEVFGIYKETYEPYRSENPVGFIRLKQALYVGGELYLIPLQVYTTDDPLILKLVAVIAEEGETMHSSKYTDNAIEINVSGNNIRTLRIADNHTFDIISTNGDGKNHRLYLTAFLDARSGIFTGCYVTSAPSSQSTLVALRRGILQYGIPDNIYVDNGREFLTYDIGGLGHRRRKPKPGAEEEFLPPPVFERLGIHMTNAIVRNAKAKLIERRFRDFKDQISRLFATYTGGNVTEKPECLKHILKSGQIPSDRQLTEDVTALIEGQLNQSPYGGSVAADRGKPRMQVYNEQMIRRRNASEDDLNLMLMRSSRPQIVDRRGVHMTVGDQKVDYYTNEFVLQMQGKKVYYRYDPTDISSVRVYDTDDRYLATLPTDNVAILTYNSGLDDVEEAMRLVRSRDRLVKDALSASTIPAINKNTALELALEEAEYNRKHGVKRGETKLIEIHRVPDSEHTPLLQHAVGDDLDIAKMVQNASKNIGGQSNEQ